MAVSTQDLKALYTNIIPKKERAMKTKTSTMGKGRGRGKPKPKPRPKR